MLNDSLNRRKASSVTNTTKIPLPAKTVYEPELAAYTTVDGVNHLWPNEAVCLFDTRNDLIVGVLMRPLDKKSSTKSPVAHSNSYVPIILLGIITFIYLCFFFFFAFKPHPHSNLAELSTIVEEEMAQLSVMAKKAVKSLKVCLLVVLQ
ncbi:hypothetical protein COOONC_01756 [Cooperia oncophora]